MMQSGSSLFMQQKNELKLSQEAMAHELGIGQSAIAALLNGINALNAANAAAIARILRVSVEDFSPSLAEEIARMYQSVDDKKIHCKKYQYPLFTEVQAGPFFEVGTYTESDAKAWIATTRKASDLAFWLEVSGHSMTAPQGSRPSFPEGMLILVDPAENVAAEDYCIASLCNSEIIFKQYQIYGGKPQLEPLNPRYDIIKITDGNRIIGKVITAQWPEDTFD